MWFRSGRKTKYQTFDLKKEYDRVLWDKLGKVLQEYGVDGQLLPRMAERYGTLQFFLRSTVRRYGTFFCNGTGTVRWYGTLFF